MSANIHFDIHLDNDEEIEWAVRHFAPLDPANQRGGEWWTVRLESAGKTVATFYTDSLTQVMILTGMSKEQLT